MNQKAPTGHRYPIRYTVDRRPDGWTKEELDADDAGGCDAVIVHSLIYPPDGSRSEMLLSRDGRTGEELSDIEVFKSWVMTAHALMDSESLDRQARDLAQTVFSSVQQRILASRRSDA